MIDLNNFENATKKEVNIDFYEWLKYDEFGNEIKTAAKKVDRTEEPKKVGWLYYNGSKYVWPNWFKKQGLTVPEKPLFFFPDFRAFKSSDTVIVCEGEKDTQTLTALGIPATTLQSGGAKIKDDQLKELSIFQGKTVLLIGDNDKTGRSYINDLGIALAKSGYPKITLKGDITELCPDIPEKGDVTDWITVKLQSGFKTEEIKNELLDFFEGQEICSPFGDDGLTISTGFKIRHEKTEPKEWIVDGLIRDMGIIQLGGAPKAGKSMLLTQLASAIVKDNGTFLGREVKHGKVVIVDFENSEETIKTRLENEFTEDDTEDKGYITLTLKPTTEIRTLENGFCEWIEAHIRAAGVDFSDIVMIVIDMLSYAQTDPANGGNSYYHTKKEMMALRKHYEKIGVPYIIVNHTAKESVLNRNIFETTMGSQGQYGGVDQQIVLYKKRDKDNRVEEIQLHITGRDCGGEKHIILEQLENGFFKEQGSVEDIRKREEEKKKEAEILDHDIGKAILELLSTMKVNECFTGKEGELKKKFQSIGCEFEDKKGCIAKFLRDYKKSAERLFMCRIRDNNPSSTNQKTYTITKLGECEAA